MKVNSSIFRSYDIRGAYPKELNEEAAYLIGGAFVNYTKAKKVVVGRDMRISSFGLFEALCRGIIDAGSDVYDIGEIPTEILYFTVGRYEYGGGIMITASHNPKEYNGFKLIKKESYGFSMIRGKDLYNTVNEDNHPSVEEKGKMKKLDIIHAYIDHILSFADVKRIKPQKIVVDAGNGMAGIVIPVLVDKLPIKVIPLNFNLDGNFPAHPSNPLEEGAMDQISRAIKKEEASFGFIFDGDADRVFLLDEKGNPIKADVTFLLLARYFLDRNPGASIVYNTICSKSVPELIQKWGGKPIKSQVGFANVRENLIKSDGVMGGELSGHYCFKDNFFGDSALLAFLVLLQVISEAGKKISELTAGLSIYAKASEINFEAEDKDLILNKIKKKYSSGRQEYLDGVTVEYNDWWFNLRPSNTEPLLRLTIEANKKELLEQKRKELTDFILAARTPRSLKRG